MRAITAVPLSVHLHRTPGFSWSTHVHIYEFLSSYHEDESFILRSIYEVCGTWYVTIKFGGGVPRSRVEARTPFALWLLIDSARCYHFIGPAARAACRGFVALTSGRWFGTW